MNAQIHLIVLSVADTSTVVYRLFLYLYPRTTASRDTSLSLLSLVSVLMSADMCRLMVKMLKAEWRALNGMPTQVPAGLTTEHT